MVLETAALVSVPGARVVHQDVAHHLRGDADEMGLAFPLDAVQPANLQVGFVNQRGGLESVIAALVTYVASRQAVHLGVNQRRQSL
jgi:hypothetical protein